VYTIYSVKVLWSLLNMPRSTKYINNKIELNKKQLTGFCAPQRFVLSYGMKGRNQMTLICQRHLVANAYLSLGAAA